MNTLFGMKVIQSEHLPRDARLELSDKVTVSPEFRAEYNAWLRERFGTKERNVAYMMSGPFGDFIVGSPLMMDTLRKRAVKAT